MHLALALGVLASRALLLGVAWLMGVVHVRESQIEIFRSACRNLLEKQQSFSSMSQAVVVLCVAALAVALRWGTAQLPYSGANTPPKYGDFEAQRHWMEVSRLSTS